MICFFSNRIYKRKAFFSFTDSFHQFSSISLKWESTWRWITPKWRWILQRILFIRSMSVRQSAAVVDRQVVLALGPFKYEVTLFWPIWDTPSPASFVDAGINLPCDSFYFTKYMYKLFLGYKELKLLKCCLRGKSVTWHSTPLSCYMVTLSWTPPHRVSRIV